MSRRAATTMPLDGLHVRLGDSSATTRAAGWWLAALGAALVGPDGPASGSLPTPADVTINAEGPTAGGLAVQITAPPDLVGRTEAELATGLWARSGLASITFADEGPSQGAPCLPSTTLPQVLAGTAAALLVAAWSLGGDRGSPRETAEVDALELLCMLPMQPVAAAQLPASSGSRAGGAVGGSIGGVVSSVDGLVYLRLVEPAQWQRLLADIPATAEVARSVVSEPTVLDREAEAINRALDAWAASQTTTQMLESARRLQVPVAPFVDVARLAADDHLVARGYADGERVDLRVPWIIDAARDRPSSWRPPRLRPTAQQPLRGVRILDLTWAWAGPFATTLLAELGAEVINIEWYPRPSNLRVQGPAVDEFGIEGGGWWSANQRGKRSVALDLKHPDAHRAVLELAAVCDAAIENFSPGVSNRLGLGFDDLAARNANLVYLSMSAYGATGPRSSERGYGPHLYASAGYAGLLRGPHGERSQMGIPLADPISGLVAALALTAHLRGPQAVHIDLSELEATCAVRGEPLRSDSPFDAPIRSIADTLRDPYLIARGAWVPDRSAAMRGRDVRIARAPWRMDADRLAQISGAAELGADTREVLIEHVGWNAEDVDRLVSAGAAVDPAS